MQMLRGLISYLLISNARQIPDHEAPVCPAGGQDGLILGAPADLEDLLWMVVKSVQGLAKIPEIVQGDLALENINLCV